MTRWSKRLALLGRFTLGLCASLLSCESGELAPATEDRAAVVVDITGTLTETADPEQTTLDDISVGLFVTSAEGERQAIAEPVMPDSAGSFELQDIELRPWEETYELVISDAGAIYRERSLAVFALAAGTLDYGEIGLTRIDSGSFTQVRGLVRDASSGVPIEGAQVKLFDEREQVARTTTNSDGEFSVEGVLVQAYRLEILANEVRTAAAPNGYIPDNVDVPLAATADNNLGSLFVAPKRLDDELILVFSGPKTVADDGRSSQRCLERLPGPSPDAEFRGASHLFLPPDTLDVNGAYGLRKKRWGPEGLTHPDGFGFGTQFWPVFLGLRSGTSSSSSVVVPVGQAYEPTEEGGIRYGQEQRRTRDAGETFVHAKVFDFDDVRIETMTVLQRNPMASGPESLSYYYVDGDEQRYPVGVGLFSANVTCFETAELKVYQGDGLVGRFELAKSSEVRQLGELTEWAPMLLEYGFTHHFPEDEDDPPKPEDAIYFNVIPFSALDLTADSPLQAYEQPGGIQGVGQEVDGWDPVPDSLFAAASGREHAVFLGQSDGNAGMWVLDASSGPVRTDTHVAGSSSLLPAATKVLATTLSTFGQGAEVGAVAVREDAETSIVQWLPEEQVFPFECGEPLSLGYVGGMLLVGTEQGATTVDCGQQDEFGTDGNGNVGATWVLDVVAADDAPRAPITLIREHENESGFLELMLGTRGSGLWLGNPGNQGWRPVEGIDGDATVTDVAVLGDELFISTTTALYEFVAGNARLLADASDEQFPKPSNPNDGGGTYELRAVTAFRGRLYLGTNGGIIEYDIGRRAACERDPASPLCAGSGATMMLGFPVVGVNAFATLAGRLYALTNRGLFELLAADTSLSGAVSDSESIRGLEGIPLPDMAATLPPPEGPFPMPPMGGGGSGNLPPPDGMGGAPMNPPLDGMGGAPMNPPPDGMGGAPMNPPPSGMGGAPMNPPPNGIGGAPMNPPPDGVGGAPVNPPPNGIGGAPMNPPPDGMGGGAPLPP